MCAAPAGRGPAPRLDSSALTPVLSEKVFLRRERTVLSRDDGLSLTLDQVMRRGVVRGMVWRGVAHTPTPGMTWTRTEEEVNGRIIGIG